MQKLGRKLAGEMFQRAEYKNKACVLVLQGDMGAGKTTFLQGFAKGLGITDKVLSPTFVIQKKFQIPNSKLQISKFKYFYHIDCYRINKPEEILELGFKKTVSNPKNIVAVEWPERIKKVLPKTAIKIKFKFINLTTREIAIYNKIIDF